MTTRKSDTLQAEEEVYVTSDASPATSWTREVRPRLQPAARAELLQARSEADEALVGADRTAITAQTCFTDGLHLIFAFLPLSDISSSSSVCRRWLSTVSSESPRCIRCDVESASALRDLATSNLRRHVQTLDITQDEDDEDEDDDDDSSLLLVGDLPELISRRLPRLTHLVCTVDLRRLDGLQFPAGLRTLEVHIIDPQSPNDPWPNFSVLLSCVSRVPLTKLRIATASEEYPPADTMEPLRHLRDTIIDLEFSRSSDEQWTAEHFALFRSLPHLTRLDIAGGEWHDEELELLTAEPAPTHLQSLNCDVETSSHRLSCISRLTSLTDLDLTLTDPVGEPIDLSPLGRLTRLETLHLMVNQQGEATQVVDALKTCTSLTSLILEGVRQLTDTHLCDLLPSLTGLRRLELRLQDQLDDLSCLSAASNLADTLEHICVERQLSFPAVPSHALFHLRSLHRLRSAELFLAGRSDTVETTAASESDSEAVDLPMVEYLRMSIGGEGGVDLYGMLGRLPQLSVVHLSCTIDIDLPPLVHFLTRTPSLTKLEWQHPALTDALLCCLIPSLPHLRDLALRSESLKSLRFASSSVHLAHSLEKLAIADYYATHSLPVSELSHLRSLVALRHLQLVLPPMKPAGGGEEHEHTHSNDTDSGAAPASLAALTTLNMHMQHVQYDSLESLELDLSILGPMPQLRSCDLRLDSGVQVASIARALAHSTQLDNLQIAHPFLTDSHLVALMPHFTHLTSLNVSSESHLGGLSFASSPRLAATLASLAISTTDTTPMKPSDLHHLRTLAQLTDLRLRFPESLASLEADLEELTLDSPRFRHDCWPRLRDSNIDCE